MTEALASSHVWKTVQRGEAILVDLRTPAEFAQAHPKGAISLPYSEKGLADRLGIVLSAGTSVILLVSEEAQVKGAVSQLHGSQFSLGGVVEGGLKA